jgi:hypothetical protein
LFLGAGQIAAGAISPVDAQAIVGATHAEGERFHRAGGRLTGPIGTIVGGWPGLALFQLLHPQLEAIEPFAFGGWTALAAHQQQSGG